jgi:hypothetical protein
MVQGWKRAQRSPYLLRRRGAALPDLSLDSIGGSGVETYFVANADGTDETPVPKGDNNQGMGSRDMCGNTAVGILLVYRMRAVRTGTASSVHPGSALDIPG